MPQPASEARDEDGEKSESATRGRDDGVSHDEGHLPLEQTRHFSIGCRPRRARWQCAGGGLTARRPANAADSVSPPHSRGTRMRRSDAPVGGAAAHMRNAIAVMNTKGGVGKSTLVRALAETLSAERGKTVLVIDSDAQASVSSMLMTIASLHKLQTDGLTLVDYLVAAVLSNANPEWPRFVVGNVSDVDEARSVYLIASDMQLTLLEREVSKENLHARLREAIAQLLTAARKCSTSC